MMDIVEAIRTRKSIRGYRKDPVPREVLKEILDTAIRAPSASNMQPWQITVVSGRALDNIRQGNVEALASRVTPAAGRTIGEKYRERQLELAVELYGLLGIDREDREKRNEWLQRGLSFFDAPVVIFLSADESFSERQSSFDCGCLAQTICLAALNFGLGSCIMGLGIIFPEVVRRFTTIPASERLIISIALGYPDWGFPANSLVSKRESLSNIVRWCE